MICTAISDKDIRKVKKQLSNAEMAEIRLDLTGFSLEEISEIFTLPLPFVVTFRPGKYDEEYRKQMIQHAIKSGALYVDIELEAPVTYINEMIEYAHPNKCEVIISYHNYEETPDKQKLEEIVEECFRKGADIAKVACMVNKTSDNARLLGLLESGKRLVTIGMGPKGIISRVISPFLGAEFTFVSPDDDPGTAPGQISFSAMNKILNILKEL
jgi:3-dehydroquinate dehydratase-1